jgi:DNA-binding FadR family transcriptional regulator
MSLLLVITPDILKNYNSLKVCSSETILKTSREHREIMKCIIEQNEKGAEEAMRRHLQDVSNFSENLTT